MQLRPKTGPHSSRAKQEYRQSVVEYFELAKSLPLPLPKQHVVLTDMPSPRGDLPRSNQEVLERTISEQHKVISLLNQFNKSLEEENKHFCEKIDRLEREVQKAQNVALGPSMAERELCNKEEEIADLKEQIMHLEAPLVTTRSRETQSNEEQSDLREQNVKMKRMISDLKEELVEKHSLVVESETKVNALRHELSKVQGQLKEQKSTVVSLQSSIAERDGQLSQLSKAWMNEKHNSSALHQTQDKLLEEMDALRAMLERSPSPSSEAAAPQLHQRFSIPSLDKLPPLSRVSLFDQVVRRDIVAMEMSKQQGQELGFKYHIVDTPISSKGSSLIVSSVKEDSQSDGLLYAGDEILEVNGFLCRGILQNQALLAMKHSQGKIKLVVARELRAGQDRTHHVVKHALTATSTEDVDLAPLHNCTPNRPLSPLPASPSASSVSSDIIKELQESVLGSVEEAEEDQDFSVFHHNVYKEGDMDGTVLQLQEEVAEKVNVIKEKNQVIISQEKTIKRLTDNANGLHAQLKESHSQINTAKAESEKWKLELESLHSSLDLLTAERDSLKNNVAVLQCETSDLKSFKVTVKSQLDQKESELREAHQRLQIVEENAVAVEEKMSSLQKSKESYLIELRETRDALKLAHSTLDEEREGYGKNLLEVQKELNKSKSALQLQVSKLNRLRESSGEEIVSLQEALKRATDQLALSKETLASHQEQAHANKMTTSELEGLAKEAEVKLLACQHDLKEGKHEIAQLQVEVDRLSVTVKSLEATVDTLTAEKQQLKENLESMQQTVGEKEDLIGQLEVKVQMEESAYAEVRGTLANLEKQIKCKQQECDDLQKDLNTHMSTKLRLDKEVEAIRAELESEREKATAISAEKCVSKQAHERATEEVSILNRKLVTMETTIGSLQGDLTGALDKAKSSKSHLKDLRESYKELERGSEVKIASLEAERDGLQKEVERLSVTLQEYHNSSSSESETLTLEIARLDKDNNEQKTELMNRENEKIVLTQELDRLKSLLEKQRDLAVTAHQERDALQQTVDILKTSLHQLEDSHHLVEERLRGALAEGKQKEALNADLLTQMKKLAAEVILLKRETATLKETRTSHESEIMSAQFQLSQVSRQLSESEQTCKQSTGRAEELNKQCQELQLQLERQKSVTVRAQTEASESRSREKQMEETLKSNNYLLEELNNKASSLEHQLDQKRVEIGNLENTWEDLQKDLQSKLRHLASENVSLKEMCEMIRSQLKAELNQKDELKETYEKEKSELTTKYKLKTEELDHLREVSSINQALLDNMTAEAESYQKENEDFKLTSEALCQENEKLAKQLNSMTSENRDLQQKLTASETEKNSVLLMHQEATASLKQEKKIALDLQDNIQALRSTSEMNHSILEAVELENIQLKASLSDTQEQHDVLVEQLREAATSLKHAHSELSAHRDMVAQLQASLKSAEDGLRERDRENASLQQQVHTSASAQSELVDKLRTAEQAKSEAQLTVSQLITAQSALKEALTVAGDQKDKEILKLRETIMVLQGEVGQLKEEREIQNLKETNLGQLLEQVERDKESLNSILRKTKDDLGRLKYEQLKVVSSLQESLDSKELSMREVAKSKDQLEIALKEAVKELDNVQYELASLVSLKVIVAEKETLLDTLHKEVKSLRSQQTMMEKEKSQLLELLRKHEVVASTKQPGPQPTPKQVRGASKEQLTALVKQRDEEVYRMKEYVQKLLAKVIEKAPHLLETMHT